MGINILDSPLKLFECHSPESITINLLKERIEMKNLFLCLSICLLLSINLWAQNQSGLVEISLKNNNDVGEISTKDQLHRLLRQFDVSKWIFTKKILIDRDATPHSHPILTLSTKLVKDDELLLSTFVHEQIHWFLEKHNDQRKEAVAELKTIFPTVPTGYPEGAMDEESSYLHLLVCYSEYQANKKLFGELKARQIMEFWATSHYTWIYKQVLLNERKIGSVLRKYKLVI